MSIVSSRVSSISSILKTPGVRTALTGQKRIGFKLPKDLENIFENVTNGKNRQQYQDLICILRDSTIKDPDFLELLSDARKCIYILKAVHKSFVEALLNIDWRSRSPEVIFAFKEFISDLMYTQDVYSKFITLKLLQKFKPENKDEKEWPTGKCPEEKRERLNHIHDIFKECLKTIPGFSSVLFNCIEESYPHFSSSTHTNELYLFSVIQIMRYAPKLQRVILFIIINRLTHMDTYAPVEDTSYHEEEEMEVDDIENGAMFSMSDVVDEQDSERNKLKRVVTHTLDVCMGQLLSYIYEECHVNDKLDSESLEKMFQDLLYTFDQIILMTHKPHHVQFVMFSICSFDTSVMEAFVKWLWQKVSDPKVASTIRQPAVYYIASLLARAKFTRLSLLQKVISALSNFVHGYIQSEDSNSDIRVHTIFYSMCQALFYLIAFRQKDLTDGKRNLMFLEELYLSKIVSCKLNPLKFCHDAVAQNFDVVTRNYQLAYCQTVIQRNKRNHLPTIDNDDRGDTNKNLKDAFFPFDPYVLKLSGQRISHLYCSSQGTVSETVSQVKNIHEHDEDDFMDESFSQESRSHREKFLYSSSPGFVYA